MNKEFGANEIVRFYKSFKLSACLSIIFFLLLYFVGFQVYKTIKPNFSKLIYPPIDRWERNDGGLKIKYYDYGDNFLNIVLEEYQGDSFPPSISPLFRIEAYLSTAIKYYRKRKFIESLFYSGIFIIVLPFFISISRIIIILSKNIKSWVNNNRTI